MSWCRRLVESIILRDGRIVATLSDARALILALPVRHQISPHWQSASAPLQAAAEDKGDYPKRTARWCGHSKPKG
jgi:hypothetical protein